LLTVVIGWVWLPESLAPSSRTTGPWNQRAFNPLSTLTALAKVPGVAGDLLALFLFELAFNGANAISQVFCINAFRASPGDIAILATVAGLSTVVVQGVLVRPLSSRFGERRLLKAGLTLYAAVLPMTAVVPRFWLVYPVTAAGAVCYALIWPGLTASLSRAVGSARQGALSGVSTAGAGVMSVLGPLICARAYDRLGGSWPYLFSSSMMVAALVAVSWRGTSTGRGEALASGPEGPRPMP
jgi:MFS family permease